MTRAQLSFAILIAAVSASRAQRPDGWPQLHGPTRNATASAPIAGGASLSVAWKLPLPSGGAGIAVADDRAYTLGSDGDNDVLFAIDAASGEESWHLAIGRTHADAAANGPVSTPAVAGDSVFTVSTLCQLQAVSTTTHRVMWTQDLGAAFASRFAKRGGCAMSPLIAGSRVVIVTGSVAGPRLAAFDLATGKLAWTSTDLPDSYNLAPGWMMSAGGATILYHHTRPPGVSGITGVSAETGAVRWQLDGVEGASNATPVIVGERGVLLETWGGVTLYDIASRRPLWTVKDIAAQGSPAVVHAGHIFSFGGQSGEFLTCVDAATGTVKWSSRIYRGHLALAGDTLVVLSESSGLLRLVAADPSAYRELTRVQVLTAGARTGTPPSIAGNRIFVRNLDELVAVNVE